MNINIIPFDFVCQKYTQNVKKDSPIFLQIINIVARQLFLTTTFWDNSRTGTVQQLKKLFIL